MGFTEGPPQVQEEMRLMCCTWQHSKGISSTAEAKGKIYCSCSPRKGETEVPWVVKAAFLHLMYELTSHQLVPQVTLQCAMQTRSKNWEGLIPLTSLNTCSETASKGAGHLPGEYWALSGNDTIDLLWHGMNHAPRILAPHTEPAGRLVFRGWTLCLVRRNAALFPWHP